MGAEMSSLGAFVETVKKYKELDVCKHLWDYGSALKNIFVDIAKEAEVENFFEIKGPAISMSYNFINTNGGQSAALRTLFQQEMIKNKVMMPWIP